MKSNIQAYHKIKTGAMSMVDCAFLIAVVSHDEQTDKAGELYLDHPIRVSSGLFRSGAANITGKPDASILMASVLHDVVEDTPWTLSDLRDMGICERAVELVDLMTRRDSETYAEYIGRVATDVEAATIKVADLLDNTRPARGWAPPESMVSKRYKPAFERLAPMLPASVLDGLKFQFSDSLLAVA